MPESTVAAAPPSPAPSTSAPAAPPPPERPASDWMGSIESDFADMSSGKEPEAPVEVVEPKRDGKGKFKPADKSKPAPATKAETKPSPQSSEKSETDQVKTEDSQDAGVSAEKTEEAPKPVRAAELRNAYDGLKKRVKEEYEPQLQSLKSKVQELESRQPEDTAPVIAKLTALEKRNEELERHITYVDYQQSKEFTTKFSEPYQEAWTDAVSEFRELTVNEPDAEPRAATEHDLLFLANLKLSDMDTKANEMFGPSAARAINHIQNLKKLSAMQNKALAEAKTKAGEWKSQQTLESQRRQETSTKTWADINKSLEERFPKAFHVEQNDAEDAASHTKGFALADLLFLGNSALTPEQTESLPEAFRATVKANQPLSEVQKVQLHALARLKMANHDRKVSALRKATTRIAELEKMLDDYENSEPAAGKAGGGGSAVTDKDWQDVVSDELKALDK